MLDVVQVVAWSRMFAGYVDSLPVGAAIQRTFDGREPCPLCLAVQKARAADRAPARAPAPVTAKLVLFCQRAEASLPPVALAWEIESEFAPASTRRDPVPVRPPRPVVMGVG